MRKSIRIGIFSKARVKEINTFIIISSEKISNELKEFKLESENKYYKFSFFFVNVDDDTIFLLNHTKFLILFFQKTITKKNSFLLNKRDQKNNKLLMTIKGYLMGI